MRKRKEYNLFNKIRAALRDVYRYSPMRKEAINKVSFKDDGINKFKCPYCKLIWPVQMIDVDHEPPLGPLDHFTRYIGKYALGDWAEQLFYGNVQVLCKLCHKKKTFRQRRLNAKK